MSAPAPDLDPSPDCDADGLHELVDYQRPRLRPEVPIMWRTSNSVQIGNDVILTDVTRTHVAWMTSFDGVSSRTAIEESLTIPVPQARRLLRALIAAAALEDAARVPISVRWAAPRERDAEYRRFAVALSSYRQIDRAHAVIEQRDRQCIRVRGLGPLAQEMRHGLIAAGLTCVDAEDSEGAEGAGGDLVILADSPHPHVPSQVEIPAIVAPHLHAGVHADLATIGPLVVPGVTSCLRCLHLHRRDADPAWPLLSVQWAHALGDAPVTPIDPLLARLAADWAALLVRAWVDLPDQPDAWGNVALDVRLPLGDVRVRECAPHPLCGCRWAGDHR